MIPELKPDRFEDAVPDYLTGRLRYDPLLIAWLAREAGLSEASHVLDLGCGPGFLANSLAPFAGQVTGMDPNARMLEAARGEAEGLGNVTYREGSSFDLTGLEGPLDLVTMGRSFHWMDRDATLAALDPLLAPNGAIAVIGDRVLDGPQNAWYRAMNAEAREMGLAAADAETKHRYSDNWEPHQIPLLRSAFSDLRGIAVIAQHRWSWDKIVSLIASRSGTTRAGLGANFDSLIDRVRDAIGAPNHAGEWISIHEHHALIARRPA